MVVTPTTCPRCIVLESKLRLGVALSRVVAEKITLRTFVLMRSEVF